MPMHRRTVSSIPQIAQASTRTSESLEVLKQCPLASKSARISLKLYSSPLYERTKRPSAEGIGWCPPGERSTTESRRCASATFSDRLTHRPPSSGPRELSVLAIDSAIEDKCEREAFAEFPTKPVIPHMGAHFLSSDEIVFDPNALVMELGESNNCGAASRLGRTRTQRARPSVGV